MVETITKRDGRSVPFDSKLIQNALQKCFSSTGITPSNSIESYTSQAVDSINSQTTTVEIVQDAVQAVLMKNGEFMAASHYIIYRNTHSNERKYRPVPIEVKNAFDENKRYFKNDRQVFQYLDKYAKFDQQLGRRETWPECVNRVMNYLKKLSQYKLSEEIYNEIQDNILHLRVMPSMRLLAMAGPAAERNNVCIYNCAYLLIDSIESFCELLLLSMSGCGVGYSVESHNVAKLPRVEHQTGEISYHTVEDTTEGWVDAIRIAYTAFFNGDDVVFDFTKIRPAGSLLRTKGGRASGPEPLRKGIEFARKLISSCQGGYVSTLIAHDLACSLADAAVCGGVRRSALISLFDFNDDKMANCKSENLIETGNTQRWNANNSAVWPDRKLNQQEVLKFMQRMYDSNNGEPGIFSRAHANASRPDRRSAAEFGVNPCVTGDTLVLTNQGMIRVDELIGKQFTAVIDGNDFSSTEDGFWLKGEKPVYQVMLDNGSYVNVTENHKILSDGQWIEARNLKIGEDFVDLSDNTDYVWNNNNGTYEEGYFCGQLIGDGTFDMIKGTENPIIALWVPNDTDIETYQPAVNIMKLVKTLKRRSDSHGFIRVKQAKNYTKYIIRLAAFREIADRFDIHPLEKKVPENGSYSFTQGLLQGFFDADSSVQGTYRTGMSIRLAQSDLGRLESVQRLLFSMGIYSKIYKNRRPEQYKSMPDGCGGMKKYLCKAQHELILSNEAIYEFRDHIGFSDPAKSEKLDFILEGYTSTKAHKRTFFRSKVVSVEPIGTEKVYDCTIPGPHRFSANGILVKNCGEVILRPFQFCNLTSAIMRSTDTEDEVADKVRVAAILGTIQSMASDFKGLRPIWKENVEEERLLGVDLNGQADYGHDRITPEMLLKLKALTVYTNRYFANILGINQSTATSCVKPSGNSSEFLDCSSGLHNRWARYYIRRMRIDASNPLLRVLKDAGVPLHPENGQMAATANTWVAEFPVETPANRQSKTSAIEQLKVWAKNKVYWTEHNPSVTITYTPDETIDVAKWIHENQSIVGGIALLPASDARYNLMPYEEISEERYKTLVAAFPSIDYSKIYRYEESDQTTSSSTPACSGDKCMIERPKVK